MPYKVLRKFFREDRAQDLIEYTLLLGFVALVSAGLMAQSGLGLQGIWGGASSTIALANGGSPDTSTTPPPSGGGGSGSGDHGHGDHDGH